MRLPILILLAFASTLHAGRIDLSLKSRLLKGEILDVVIQFPSNDDVFTSFEALGQTSTEARTASMISILQQRAETSRKPFVSILKEMGLGDQRSITDPLWITNLFEVKDCDLALAEVLVRVPGDFTIREQLTYSIIEPVESHPVDIEEVRQNQTLQWGVEMIQADEAWSITRGEGVVVGIIDTGVYRQHEALNNSYAGAWLDPYYNTSEPDDLQSHGTHCIGSTLGSANGIGVAPAAQWIACRGLDHDGYGSDAELLRCAQWMLNGSNPRPQVVTNSWGGGENDPFYNEAMRAWIVAGIIPVFAIGNSGPSCRSAGSPGDSIYALAVGATTNTDAVSSFSSRGPGGLRLKPDVSAPGSSIISAGNNSPNEYTTKSGTSMATPHVAGVIALLLSQDPTLGFNEIKDILQSTGDRPPVSDADLNCGAGPWPNHAFGHGRVNAARAVGANVTRHF